MTTQFAEGPSWHNQPDVWREAPWSYLWFLTFYTKMCWHYILIHNHIELVKPLHVFLIFHILRVYIASECQSSTQFVYLDLNISQRWEVKIKPFILQTLTLNYLPHVLPLLVTAIITNNTTLILHNMFPICLSTLSNYSNHPMCVICLCYYLTHILVL